MSDPAFCSPNDPVPGLDAGRSAHRGLEQALQLAGIQLSLKHCSRVTQGPRRIHGLDVRQGNRLDQDLKLSIGGQDWKGFVGLSLAMAPFSPLAELENNLYGRFGLSFKGYSVYFSNDVFAQFAHQNDQSYTGTLGFEFPLPGAGSLAPAEIRFDVARLRLGGTTGIPEREGPIIERDGRRFYGDVAFEEAAAGFAALEVSGTFGADDPVPFTLGVTLIKDEIRQQGQGIIHRLIEVPEFQQVKDETGAFVLFRITP